MNNDLSEDTGLLEFIENMTANFSNFNENFMGGYIKVEKNFYNYLHNNKIVGSRDDIYDYFDKLEVDLTTDKNVSLNDSIEKAVAFFSIFGPKYEQMIINYLKQAIFTKGNNMSSNAYSIKLSGNESDGAFIAHEAEHAFVISKNQTDQSSPITHIISEINSFVYEFLFYDFCESRGEGNFNRSDLLFHMLMVADQSCKSFESTKNIFRIFSSNRAFEELDKIYEYFGIKSSYDKDNSQIRWSNMMLGLSHPFGIMVASYIYQKILDDPSNIKMCLGLEKAQGVVGEEEVTLRFLENLGIPCFKDGKISLDDDCVSLLSGSLIKTFDMCHQHKEKSVKLFDNYPVIAQQYMDEVNAVWYETEQKANSK